jgi:NTP pyrophosphatase (non-canonical NTP hydrolase)
MKFGIKELQIEVHENAIEHGWWEEERTFGELIALCHSELSEALEEFRKGKHPTESYHKCKKDDFCVNDKVCNWCKWGKPEGVPSELADTFIRILDMAEHYGINLELAIREKHEFNKGRPYKHGGKVI